MTGPTLAAAEEIALCLTCEREDCDGGSPDCPWGRVYYYEPDREHRMEYMKEYSKRRKQREETNERPTV